MRGTMVDVATRDGVAVVAYFAGYTPPGWTSVMVSVLAIGGLQMIFIGLIGEYLARIFDEVKGRPTYLLKSPRLGHPTPDSRLGDRPGVGANQS